MDRAFRPAQIGFGSPPEHVRAREAFRQGRFSVVFLGAVPRAVALGALEAVCGGAGGGARVDAKFTGWDALADCPAGRDRICDVCNYLYQTRQRGSDLLVFSELHQAPADLWEFIYERPRVRIAWLAEELGGCRDRAELELWRQGSAALANLEKIGNAGLWPHVVLPVTGANVKVLPDLVLALLEATRGGSIEVRPAGLMPRRLSRGDVPDRGDGGGAFPLTPTLSPGERERQRLSGLNRDDTNPASVEDYVGALMEIYRNPRIPLRLVSPLSWVAARVGSQGALVSSAASVGAEAAVLPNGDLCAGEEAVGLERWRLGNVLEDAANIRWERLDVMAEAFSNALLPDECKQCDWRYRCGGVDACVMLSDERDGPSNGRAGRFEFYCAPRKRLFEELVWDSAEQAALGRTQGPRERIELREDGIDFEPVKNEQPA
jgi:radical SAM protein with 4Fe4S-binding SPASM domain